MLGFYQHLCTVMPFMEVFLGVDLELAQFLTCFFNPFFFFFPETMYFFHRDSVGRSYPSLTVPIVLESKMSC